MESQIDKQEYTASAQSRARDGTGGINQPSDVCGFVVLFSNNVNDSGKDLGLASKTLFSGNVGKIYFRMIPFHTWAYLRSPVKFDQTAPCMPFIP